MDQAASEVNNKTSLPQNIKFISVVLSSGDGLESKFKLSAKYVASCADVLRAQGSKRALRTSPQEATKYGVKGFLLNNKLFSLCNV